MADPKQSRGFRNRNPGNIDYVPANKWQGQVGIEDPPAPGMRARFAKFTSHEYGIRALAALLTTYQDRHNLHTVRAIINRWAPPGENDTGAYVNAVARSVGVAPDAPVDMHRFEVLRPMVVAVITHELGGNPYDAATIDRGLALAGVTRRVDGVVAAASTERGRGALQAAGATGVAGIGGIVLPAISGLQGLDWRLGVVIVVVGAAVGLYLILRGRVALSAAKS